MGRPLLFVLIVIAALAAVGFMVVYANPSGSMLVLAAAGLLMFVWFRVERLVLARREGSISS